MHVDVLYHRLVDPCSGMMMSTWAPGNAGRPSFKGTSSSHLGTIAMRAVPPGEIAADPGQPLAAARIAEPAHALDQRGLERGRVPPARPEALALRRFEGVAEPYPRVRHRDHDHPLRELAAPVVGLHRYPAARARVFYNIL